MHAIGTIVSAFVVFNLYNVATRKGSLLGKIRQAYTNQSIIESKKEY